MIIPDLKIYVEENGQTVIRNIPRAVVQERADSLMDKIREIKNDPSNPEKLACYRAFFDQTDDLSQQEKIDLIQHTIDEFGLHPNTPNRLQAEYTTMTLDFDPNTYQSNIRIRILEPSDLTLTNDAMDHITVTGSLIDPNTFDVLPYGTLDLAGEPVLEQKDVAGLPPQYFLNIPVRGAMEWGLVHVDTGAITSDSQGDEVGYFLIARGPYGLHHIMAMRPLPLDEQGKSLMTPPTYGAPEPKQLPAIPQDQLESMMWQNLENALQKAVDYGDITQDEANSFLAKFDDPQLIDIAKDPTLRAALLLGASIKETGGNLILPVVLGQNSNNSIVRLYASNDPRLDSLFQGKTRPSLEGQVGIVWRFDDGSAIILLNRDVLSGKEPVETLASLMSHEVLAHESSKDSFAEETVGNLLEAISWSKLIQRDPGLLARGTFETQFSNLLLYSLLNSVYVNDQKPSPMNSHVGLTSRITSIQAHDRENINVFPNNNVQMVHSFYEFVKYIYSDSKLISFDPVSSGSKVTLQLLKELFGDDVETPDQFDLNNDSLPDFSDLFITDFLDQHVQDLIPDEMFKELAQELHMTLDGRDLTP